MKRNLILVVLAIFACLLTLGQIPLNAKSIRQFLKEYKEKYEGKTVYVISREEFPAPYEYSISCEISLPVTIRGNTLFITRDSSVVILRKKFDDKYKCTKVYLAHKNSLYGKSDAIALNLNYEGRNYPVLIYGWDSSMTGRIIEPIKVKTSIGDHKVTVMYPQNIIIAEDDLEEELESLRTQLQITYSSAWCVYRKEEAAKAKREEESRLRREEAVRVALENHKKKVEQQKAEEEAKKKQLEEKARMAAEAEEKKREEKAKFIAGLDEKSLKTYSGKMTSTPNWIEDIVKACERWVVVKVVSGTYSYFSIIEDDEEERIPHGQFVVICEYLQNFRREIKGHFNRGKRDGVWTISVKNDKGEYYPYDSYKFRYKNGMLNGDFRFKPGRVYIKNGELKNEDFSAISGTFLNGKLMSAFITDGATGRDTYSGLKGSSVIKGDVNDKGNPHGKWTEKSESDPRQITYLFYDGCLLYQRIKDESTGNVKYKCQASPQVRKPSDIEKVKRINDKIVYIDGEKYCTTEKFYNPWPPVFTALANVIYPGFSNWCLGLEKCK